MATGLAFSADGTKLYACGSLGNRLHEIDAVTGKPLRQWQTGVAPLNVIVTGTKAYVSCLAGPRPQKGDFTADVGRGVQGLVDSRSIARAGSVVVIDLAGNKVLAELETGPHCGALALSPKGEYVVAANAGSDTLSVISTISDTVVEKVWARATPADPFGAQPCGVVFDPGGQVFYVANATQNAVAVVKFEPKEKESKVIGLIPNRVVPGGPRFRRGAQDAARRQHARTRRGADRQGRRQAGDIQQGFLGHAQFHPRARQRRARRAHRGGPRRHAPPAPRRRRAARAGGHRAPPGARAGGRAERFQARDLCRERETAATTRCSAT